MSLQTYCAWLDPALKQNNRYVWSIESSPRCKEIPNMDISHWT